MGLQRVFSYIAMETVLAKVLALPVLALIVEETFEVLAPGVVKGLGSIRGYFGLNILRKLNTFV